MMERRDYHAEPTNQNPGARLDGAWRVIDCKTGRVLARFSADGRDLAERWIIGRRARDEAEREAEASGSPWMAEPSRWNPYANVASGWRVRDRRSGKIVARFDVDGLASARWWIKRRAKLVRVSPPVREALMTLLEIGRQHFAVAPEDYAEDGSDEMRALEEAASMVEDGKVTIKGVCR
jgi:hypothetical protein